MRARRAQSPPRSLRGVVEGRRRVGVGCTCYLSPSAISSDRRHPNPTLTFFLATVRPDGRPHSAGVGAVWVDDALYFVSGPGTLKSRNLAANPACSFSVRLPGIDLVLEGEAQRVTDSATLERRRRSTDRAAGRSRWRVTRSPRGKRTKRRTAAVVPVPPRVTYRRRSSRRRTPWRHPLGLRPLDQLHLRWAPSFLWWRTVLQYKGDDVGQTCRRQTDAAVGSPVVEAQLVAPAPDDHPAWKTTPGTSPTNS